MFGKKPVPQAPTIVSQDARDMLPGARDAQLRLREAMRSYPALWNVDEFHRLTRELDAMVYDLETLAGEGAHRG